VVKKLGKKAEIICPSEVNLDLGYLKHFDKIETINFSKFDFSKHDLLITLDSADWYLVSGDKQIKKPDIPIIKVDHHGTGDTYGMINLIKKDMPSNAELLYYLYQDWGIKITKDLAMALLVGIIGDTGVFRYPNTTTNTLRLAADLIDKGADKERIVESIYSNLDIKILKFWGEVLSEMEFDEKYKFAWSAIPYEVYKDFDKPVEARSMAAGLFAQNVKGVNFGMIMVEDIKKRLSISIRSKAGYDISRLAVDIGGGGHENAAGAKVPGMEFDSAVKKVLQIARKFAKNNK
jgi:phosphoesterase RecJ-like protein